MSESKVTCVLNIEIIINLYYHLVICKLLTFRIGLAMTWYRRILVAVHEQTNFNHPFGLSPLEYFDVIRTVSIFFAFGTS